MLEQNKSFQEIDKKYKELVESLILFKFRIIFAAAAIFYLIFSYFDFTLYPSLGYFFFKIRVVFFLMALVIYLLSFVTSFKHFAPWFMELGCLVLVVSVVFMVYLTEGSSSRYYEGLNLIYIGLGIVNSYYYKRNIVVICLMIFLYNLAMIFSHAMLNYLNYSLSDYFMIITGVGIFVMSYYYGDQHYKAFLRQEQLRANEEVLANLYRQADKLAKTDALTQINNRRSFSEMLQEKIRIAEASKNPFYLIIFDLDNFKQINDIYGHSFGDAALVKVVEVVKLNIRGNDFLGRFGGDEFVVCLDFPTKESLLARLTKISQEVKGLRFVCEGQPVSLSVSIGAAKFKPGEHMSEEQLMRRADTQLFNVKKIERGNISIED